MRRHFVFALKGPAVASARASLFPVLFLDILTRAALGMFRGDLLFSTSHVEEDDFVLILFLFAMPSTFLGSGTWAGTDALNITCY